MKIVLNFKKVALGQGNKSQGGYDQEKIVGTAEHCAWSEEGAKSNDLERTIGLANAGARPQRSGAVKRTWPRDKG
jgi:hypothetical protein